jgi:hypothetical protein
MVPALATDSREMSAWQSQPEAHKCCTVKLPDRADPGKSDTRAFGETFYTRLTLNRYKNSAWGLSIDA